MDRVVIFKFGSAVFGCAAVQRAAESAASGGKHEGICHQFPEIPHLQVLHAELGFDVFDLPVAAVTGDHQHGGATGLDLFHLPASVMESLLVVPIYQGAPTAAATHLLPPVGMQIDPFIHGVVQNPTGFVVETVTEQFLRLPAVVAGIVIGCQHIDAIFIQLDPLLPDIVDEQIEYRVGSDLLQQPAVMLFQTKPGRQICMASFRPHEVGDVQC